MRRPSAPPNNPLQALNTMRTSLAILTAITMSLTSHAEAKHIKIYLLTGQSNSLGTTANKKDDDPANPPASAVDKKIPFYWSNRSTRAGDRPAVLIGDSGQKITTLQKQQGEGKNTTFWGPEIAFGRALHAAGERDFMIVKASRGGGGNGFWVKDGQMYNHVIKTISNAVAAIEKHGHTFEIVCLLYVQGESNNAAEAKVAGKRFADLLDQLRNDLPNARNMQAVIGGIAAGGATKDETRRQQKELAEKREDITYFSNLDLKGQLYDRLHFDKKAKLEIGRRFFKHVSELAKKRAATSAS